MNLKHLLKTQIIWMISTKALKNTILIKNGKILIAFDDMIADM